mgnify:CR=1 FL=1
MGGEEVEGEVKIFLDMDFCKCYRIRMDLKKRKWRWRAKQLRLQLEMTMEEFAQLVGVSFTTVARWEKKKGSSPTRLAKKRIEELEKGK